MVTVGLGFIAFLYWSQPRTLAEVTTKAQVATGTYEINKAEFDRGLDLFRKEDYTGARIAFDRADPEKHDAATQFYIAYSFYRQGWGRVSNDDTLFTPGLEAVNRVIALDSNYRSTDADLKMQTPSELKTEFEDGLKITPSDFNPMRLTRERK
jgi:hypothetical protein